MTKVSGGDWASGYGVHHSYIQVLCAGVRRPAEDSGPYHHNFFNRGPLGVSSMTQPLAFNSSRMASERLKSFALRAA
jgi:hypothetical protein